MEAVGRVEARYEAGVCVVTLLGEHDLSTRAALEQAIDAALAAPARAIVADFSRAEFVDSAIVKLLVEKRRSALETGLELSVVCAADGAVARTFDLVGIAALVPVVRSGAAALEARASETAPI